MHGSLQKAQFETIMPSSSQKCPTQYASVVIVIIKHSPLFIEMIF